MAEVISFLHGQANLGDRDAFELLAELNPRPIQQMGQVAAFRLGR